MPIFRTKNERGNTTLYALMGNGISTIGKGMPVCITLRDGYFMVKQRFTKNPDVVLRCSQITKIKEINKSDLIVQKQSTGVGVLKGEVFLGLRAGTPVTKMQKANLKEYIIIHYKAASPKVIIFEKVVGTTIGSKEFVEEVRESMN